MPKYIEEKLKKEASKLGLKGKRRSAYIYSTLARIKAEEKRKKKRKK